MFFPYVIDNQALGPSIFYEIFLGVTCDGIELWLSKCSNDWTIDGNFEGFLLGAWIGWVVGLELGKNGGSELGLWDGRLIGTILGAMDGLSLGICDGTLIGYLEGFIYGSMVVKCLCFFCCRGYVHM